MIGLARRGPHRAVKIDHVFACHVRSLQCTEGGLDPLLRQPPELLRRARPVVLIDVFGELAVA